MRCECKFGLLFDGMQKKGSVREVILELTQWWLNAASLGNNDMEVQLQPDIQRKAMNKLMGLQFIMVYEKGKENILADALSRVGPFMALYCGIRFQPVWIQEVPNSSMTDSYAQNLLPRVTIHSPHGVVFSVQQGNIRRLHQLWVGRISALSTVLISTFHDSTVWGHSRGVASYLEMAMGTRYVGRYGMISISAGMLMGNNLYPLGRWIRVWVGTTHTCINIPI
jgi:hypothetical protein